MLCSADAVGKGLIALLIVVNPQSIISGCSVHNGFTVNSTNINFVITGAGIHNYTAG